MLYTKWNGRKSKSDNQYRQFYRGKLESGTLSFSSVFVSRLSMFIFSA